MTTNGVTLSHKLIALQGAGLTGINVSLDTLHQKKFEFITRRRGWDKVMRGINQAIEIGISPLKVCHVHVTWVVSHVPRLTVGMVFRLLPSIVLGT